MRKEPFKAYSRKKSPDVPATKSMIDTFQKAIEKGFESQTLNFQTLSDRIDGSGNSLNSKIDSLAARTDSSFRLVFTRFDSLQALLDRMESRLANG